MVLPKQLKDYQPKQGAGATENRILAAARQVFSEHGFAGARMEMIAARAGVNKALLHYYFRSKRQLYEVTFRQIALLFWGTVYQAFVSKKEGLDVRELVRIMVTEHIRMLSKHSAFRGLFLRELAEGAPVFSSVIQEIKGVILAPMRSVLGLLAAQIKAGRIRHIEPEHFLMNILGMSAATFLFQPIIKGMMATAGLKIDFDAEFIQKRVERIVEMACDGIVMEEEK